MTFLTKVQVMWEWEKFSLMKLIELSTVSNYNLKFFLRELRELVLLSFYIISDFPTLCALRLNNFNNIHALNNFPKDNMFPEQNWLVNEKIKFLGMFTRQAILNKGIE